VRRAAAISALILPALVATACIQRGHPLGRTGKVDVRPAISTALFAADRLDVNGAPIEPRQSPHETAVDLVMNEDGDAAFGAFVEVRVDPPDRLSIRSAGGETTVDGKPTCRSIDGAFRCYATDKGFARFIVSADSDRSGDAKVIVSWAGQEQPTTISVLPAGIPDAADDFVLLVDGIAGDAHVGATYVPLACTMGPKPMNLGSKWDHVRAREARVRATPPAAQPSAVENAPVVVTALASDVQLSSDATCEKRVDVLRLLLDAQGQSPAFYLCFSDTGGDLQLSVTSAKQRVSPKPTVIVDPEPHLLRVSTINPTIVASTAMQNLFEVAAFGADGKRVAMPVDLSLDKAGVLELTDVSPKLAPESDPSPTVITGTPVGPGTVTLTVRPRLFDMPACSSSPLTVTP
jgi:hypothetical protein